MTKPAHQNCFLALAKQQQNIFTQDQWKTIFYAATHNKSTRSQVVSEKFETVIAFLQGKFGCAETPPVLVKGTRSTLRKICDIAFSLVQKDKNPEISDLALSDSYRTAIPIPITSLNALMDFVESNNKFYVGMGQNIEVRILDIENGIMNRESRKCDIPNFDLQLSIRFKNLKGEDVTFTAETQHPLLGAEKLFETSREAYGEFRILKNRLDILKLEIEASKSEPSPEIEKKMTELTTCMKQLQKIRQDTHNKIRSDFGLDSFVKQREKILSSRQSNQSNKPRLVVST